MEFAVDGPVITRIDTGEHLKKPVSVDTRDAPRATARKCAEGLGDLAAGLPVLFADDPRVRRIPLNLKTTAIKFTTEGGRVTLFASVDAAGEFRFVVSGTGVWGKCALGGGARCRKRY